MLICVHICVHTYVNREFFPLAPSGRRTSTVPISSRYDLNTALGRIKAFHSTCNIVRLLASYARKAPPLSVALGSVIQAKSSRGELLRTITFFEGTCAFWLWRSHG